MCSSDLDSDGSVINLTGYSSQLKIRKTKGSSDTILSISEADSISIVGVSGKVIVNVSAATTANMDFDKAYYDMTLTNPSGVVDRIYEGLVFLDKAV